LIYEPPEQLAGKEKKDKHYGKAADIWSCGIIMYELLAGKHPFFKSGMDKEEVIKFLSDAKTKSDPLFDLENKEISDGAKKLLYSLLKISPS
jgi:serine/threonine protein kinase